MLKKFETSIILFILISVGSSFAYASENCTINRPVKSISTSQIVDLERCTIEEIQDINDLTEGEFWTLITKSAAAFPESKFILLAAKQLQKHEKTPVLLSHTKPMKNHNLSLALAEVHFNREMFQPDQFGRAALSKVFFNLNVDHANTTLVDAMGYAETIRIIRDLLRSTNETVVLNIVNTIFQNKDAAYEDLKAEAKSVLTKLAKKGNPRAIELLYWDHKVFAADFLYKIDLEDIEKLSLQFAGLAFQGLMLPGTDSIESAWLKKLFLTAARGDIDTYVLAQVFYSITRDEQFNVKYDQRLKNDVGDYSVYEQCVLKQTTSVFNCMANSVGTEKNFDLYTMPLIQAEIIFEHFQISYDHQISISLIEMLFSKELPYQFKNKFSQYFFHSVGLIENHISNQARNSIGRIKSDVDEFMWSKHADQIIEDDNSNFRLLNQLAMTQLTDDTGLANILNHKNLKIALPLIEQATNANFFSDLSLVTYGLYYQWPQEKTEDLVDRALRRSEELFGRQGSQYFDFAYHKSLIIETTGTHDLLSFLLEHIADARTAGIDTKIWENRLIDAYITSGKYKYAMQILERRLDEISAFEKSLKNLSDTEKLIAWSTVALPRCAALTRIRTIQERWNGTRDLSDEFKYCFNNFEYPSPVPLSVQSEIFMDYIGFDLKSLRGVNTLLINQKAQHYIQKILTDQNVSKWHKIPFAFILLKATQKEDERRRIWDEFLNAEGLMSDTPEFFRKGREANIKIFSTFSYSFVAPGLEHVDDEVIKIMEIASTPNISSPIASLEAEQRSLSFGAHDIKAIFDEYAEKQTQVQRLYNIQQKLKFGPSEQLLLQRTLLSKEQKRQLQKKIIKRSLTIEQIIENTAKGKNVYDLQNILKSLNRELRNFEYPEIQWTEIFTDLAIFQEKMRSDELYIDYRHDRSSNTLGLFKVTKDQVEYDVIPDAGRILELTKTFRAGTFHGDQAFFEAGMQIYSAIIEPYLEKDTKKILISPHSFLFNIPFGALVIDSNEVVQRSSSTSSTMRGISLNDNLSLLTTENKYLGSTFEIVLVSGIVKKNNKKTDEDYAFFGIGNPLFKGSSETIDPTFNIFQNSPNRTGIDLVALSPLPGTQKEIEAFSELPIFTSATVLTGDLATEAVLFESNKVENASVISFATHGLAAGQISEYSEPGLALSPPAKKQNGYDGFLSFTEVLNLNLNSDLVILSSCNSGSSLSLHSPPLSGLASAFLAAGSDAVIATMWQVADEPTALFINLIGQEKTKSNSWSNAHQRAISKFLLSHPEYAHPKYWAPFTMFMALDSSQL